MKLQETNKTEEYYFQGPFWIIADSFKDIHRGKFNLESFKCLSDYSGKYVSGQVPSKNQLTHKNIWKNISWKYDLKEFDYYPRGRVAIYNGTAFIHIHSSCNIPFLIDKIISEFSLEKLNIEIECNDVIQGSHYDFKLR